MHVDVLNLRRTFGSTVAVDDISFSFDSGQVFGFVGPNGAGKTTTMRILATLDEPTAGDAKIDGVSVVDEPERARRLVGYVPDNLPTHRDITVHEYLDFFARAYGLRRPQRPTVVEAVESFCNLQGIKWKMLRALSKGMKQRVSLARALVHDPKLLIMDEPAAGLDPRARVELRELLLLLAQQGKAIFISSHILTELAEVCDGAVIIERGRLLRAGTIADIAAGNGHPVAPGTAAPPGAAGGAPDTLAAPARVQRGVYLARLIGDSAPLHRDLLQWPGVERASALRHAVEFDFTGDPAAAADLLAELVRRGHRLTEFRPQRADLERVFMDLTRGDVQ